MNKVMIKDQDLFISAQEGNHESLGILLERYRPQLYATALKLLGRPAEAKDLVQETFLTALAKLHQVRNSEAIGSWLERILRNHCRMAFRSHKGVFTAGQPDTLNGVAKKAAVEQRLERQALQDWIHTALQSLPETLRVTALLRYFSKFNTYKEIARILQIPVGTVRSRLSEVRRKLETRLTETREETDDTARQFMKQRQQQYKMAIDKFYAGNTEVFFSHFSQDLTVVDTRSKREHGLARWKHEWEQDFDSQVRFLPQSIMASSSITVIEGLFKNPPHDPHHCPPAGTYVLFHENDKTHRVHIHYASHQRSS